MLAYIVAALGVLIVALGIAVAAVPATMREFVHSMQSPRFVYGAVGFRLVAGAFMIFASEACAWPAVVGAIGVVMLAAGFIGLFIGVDRVQAMTLWFLALSDTAWRIWSPGAMVFGALIVYAAV